MIDELLAILGVEAALLVFIATMTLRQRQMDVLSGRYFERPLVPPDDGSDRPRRIPARARALRGGTKTSAATARIQLCRFSPRAGLRRTLRRVLQRVMIRSRGSSRQDRVVRSGVLMHTSTSCSPQSRQNQHSVARNAVPHHTVISGEPTDLRCGWRLAPDEPSRQTEPPSRANVSSSPGAQSISRPAGSDAR
jgi:hypothetical protein